MGLKKKIVLQDTQGVLQDSECSGFKTILQYSLVDSRCIAIHKIVFQARRSCIAEKKKKKVVVLQYKILYCGRRQGCLCRKTGSCVATQRWAEALRGLGTGRAGGTGTRARGRWAL